MDDDGFESFWKVYPRKCKKGDARKAWQQTARIRPKLEELLKAVYGARASRQWQKDGGEFIPYPATWLRGECWDDQMEVDLSQLDSPAGRVCGYCGGAAVGKANGIHHCREHAYDALEGKRTKVVEIGAKDQMVDKKLASAGD